MVLDYRVAVLFCCAQALLFFVHFLLINIVAPTSQNAAKGIRIVVTSILQCKFEGTDSEMNELVLMKILNTLLACLKVPAGQLLTNNLIYEMIQTCFKLSIQMKLSSTCLVIVVSFF